MGILNSRMFLNFVLVSVCFTELQCAIVERNYKTSQTPTQPSEDQYQTIKFARSKIECGIACRKVGNCMSFSFDKKSTLCSLSRGIAKDTSQIYYASYCPEKHGYTLWKFPDMNLCLRYGWTKLRHGKAVEDCANDNAHLVLVDSDSMRLHIRDVIVAIGGGTGNTYFDGFDVGNQNVFRTSKGKVLPWTSWARGNPAHNAGEDCIAGESVDDFLFRDVYCTNRHNYICQYDLI